MELGRAPQGQLDAVFSRAGISKQKWNKKSVLQESSGELKVYSKSAWSLNRNCEIQLYELSNLEPCCQMGSLEAALLKLLVRVSAGHKPLVRAGNFPFSPLGQLVKLCSICKYHGFQAACRDHVTHHSSVQNGGIFLSPERKGKPRKVKWFLVIPLWINLCCKCGWINLPETQLWPCCSAF